MPMNRLSQIIRDRGGLGAAIKVGIARPRDVALAALRLLSSDWRTLVFRRPAAFEAWEAEVGDLGLIEDLTGRLGAAFAGLQGVEVRSRPAVAGGMRSFHAVVLWALVRHLKPAVVVETGVCNGVSSAVLLEALTLNGNGRLVSLDLPEFTDPALNTFEVWEGKGGAAIPAGREVGWLVRDDLRKSWRVELGRTQDLLKPLLQELAPVDIFIHDSEHSYENQLFEFQHGFAALRAGGVLVATDITWSNAFEDFWRQVRGSGARRAFLDPSCALVVKA